MNFGLAILDFSYEVLLSSSSLFPSSILSFNLDGLVSLLAVILIAFSNYSSSIEHSSMGTSISSLSFIVFSIRLLLFSKL